jgi:L-2-hydroxyglutarate oxidase LhgO
VRAGGSTASCDVLVNAAGLGAHDVAHRMGYPAPPLHRVKGSYFRLTRPGPFRHLVYPVPASASLGVHLTLDLAGVARFGPDEQWVDDVDYHVDPTAAAAFYSAVRRYWPDLTDGALEPDYAGVRAKVQARGEPMRDFEIHGPPTHGIPGLVHLFGIESPGLTASLALADHVADLL